jgi:hypothetical protein
VGANGFETKDYLKGWDGNVKGSVADNGAYIWICNLTKGNVETTLKGTFLLLR